MKTRIICFLLAMAALTLVTVGGAWSNLEPSAPTPNQGGETTSPATGPTPPGWLVRDTLTGDWGGGRTWLKEH